MMPLFVRKEEVTWSQTVDYLLIKVPIKGIKASKANIVTAPNYIRVHCHPFIFEVFLWGELEDEDGSCRIDETESIVVFEMEKVVKGAEWPSLDKQDLSRNEKRLLRDRAVELTQQRHASKRKALEEKRHEQRQMVVRDQIRLDGEERQRIADIKQAESTRALSELHEWRSVCEQNDMSQMNKSNSNDDGKGESKIEKIQGKQQGDEPHPSFPQPTAATNKSSSNSNSQQQKITEEINQRSESGSYGPSRGHSGGWRPEHEGRSSCHLDSNVHIDNSPNNNNDNNERIAKDDGNGDDYDIPSPQLSQPTLPATTSGEKPSTNRAKAEGGKAGEENEDDDDHGGAMRRGQDIWTKEDLECEVGSGNKNGGNSIKSLCDKTIIPIRQAGRITVNFTPREFPTPSRESTAAEEQEWLKKQAEARKKCGFNDADLRPEERDPMWLLEKGGCLMKAGSYLGAVSAYSHGIKLAPKMPELYAERAEAHLTLKNLVKTVEDASQGLELLTPKVGANAKYRLKCHVLRASGFRKLKCYPEALLDYKEALKLDPENESLKNDMTAVEAVIYEREQSGHHSDSDEN